MLGDRDVNDFVGIQEGIENWPVAQNAALEVYVFEPGRIGKDNLRAGAARRLRS